MQEAVNNPNYIRQEHATKRHASVLPRDHDHQEPKNSVFGWDQDNSSTKDQGKNNTGSEMMKSTMRKTGEESLEVTREYLSNNVERGTKPKAVVDNATGYDSFLSSKRESTTGVLVGRDIKQDVDSIARTSSPVLDQAENEGDKISDISGSRGQHPDPPKIMTQARADRGVQHSQAREIKCSSPVE